MRHWLLLVLLLAGCAPPAPRYDDPPAAGAASAIIYVIEEDWHTEIAIPLAPLTGQLTRFRSIFPDAAYLTFGFGERLYYQKPHAGVIDMVEAILPGRGVLLTTALAGPPPEMYRQKLEMVAVRITQSELDRLADFIWDSLEKSPDGRLNRIGDGPFPGYVFYGATPTYSGFYTCNTWTLEALDKAGLQAGASGTLFASQVMDRIREIAAARAR